MKKPLFILLVFSVTSCFGYRKLSSYFSSMKKKVELEYFGFINEKFNLNGRIISKTPSQYPLEEMQTVFNYEEKGLLFPQSINDGELKAFCFIDEHYYLQRKYYRSELYLSWQMNEDTFNSEIERISSTETWCNSPKYTTDLFALPAYIAIYNFYGEFEYVIIDETNLTLHYIYLFDIKKYDNLVFKKQLHPKKMLQNSDIDMANEERNYLYSMYMKEYLSSI